MLAAALALLVPAAPALAYWSSTGANAGAAQTGVLAPPTDVLVAPTSGPDVAVSWTASAALSPNYYVVRISATSVVEPACDSSSIAPIATTACVDSDVAPGTYTYRVIAVHRSWTATSAPSGEVVVTADTFLGAAASFSVLGTDATNTAVSSVSGDVGVSPLGAIVNFPPSIVGGTTHLNDATSASAAAAALVAYNDLADRTPTTADFPGDPIGLTFEPGVHHTIGAMTFTGTMTLDALGDPDAIFVFQVNGAITTAANSHVVLTGGALASNVFWQVNGAAGLGADSTFSGNILALGAITLGANAELIGRALSQAAVTLGGNVIRFTIEAPPTISITGGPSRATHDTTPTIAGTSSAAVGRPVTVTVGTQTLSTTVQAGGTWSVDAAELAAGPYTVSARTSDAAGNGAVTSQQLAVEVSPAALQLGAASPYSVLTQANVVGTGTSALAGYLGVSPGTSITGFPPGTAAQVHAGDTAAADAATAANAAYADGSTRPVHFEFGPPSGLTFHTGVHHTSVAVVLTGSLTVDAEGDSSAVFIFQIDGALSTAAASNIALANGALASNVFWIVDGAVVLGANSTFVGTILTTEAVTVGNLAILNGRALAGSTVTLANNTMTGP